MAFLTGRVVLQQYHDDLWELEKDFGYHWEEGDRKVWVWKGYLTDHASSPSIIPDFIIENTGPISNGAVPHDMIYELMTSGAELPFRCVYEMLGGQYWTKLETDRLFFAINAETEMSKFEQLLARLVRLNIHASIRWMDKEEWDARVYALENS